MRIMFLFSVLLLFEALIPPARCGMSHSSNLCVQLQGVCRKNSCDTTEESIGLCTTHKLCCRKWWLLPLVPRPQFRRKAV
ncbi:beta-defensin 130B [Sminthopsis crassicaudata]|uniref:beta-defensin 130B n=1 Tax=Sminthopsis crassicaudata TaxID=9301 RepID=UPI003D68B996